MAGTWTSERFPQFEPAIRQLTDQHRELEDEPLHLALSYDPGRDPQDIFLLEVVGGGFAENGNAEPDLFEVTFTSATGFPMQPDQYLHLVLAGPAEIETALREEWPSAREVVSALRSGQYAVLHSDAVGERILGLIRERATHGYLAAC